MPSLEIRLEKALHEREQKGLLRKRLTLDFSEQSNVTIDGQSYRNFSSNDYLGLANNLNNKQINLDTFGSGSSHLVSGHQQLHTNLEVALARFLHRDAALTFSSGYMANIAILQSLAKKGDLIISDKLNHASIIDGAKLSDAEVVRYPHCNLINLEQRLKKQLKHTQANKWVVTDSIFSMDGDLAPLKDIANLCKKYSANLIVDDAHGLGVLGKNGAGACEHFELDQNDCPVLMSTLSKGLGGYGAVVSGKKILIDYLIQFARPYIYTTAPPPINAKLNSDNLKKVIEGRVLREQLNKNITYFQSKCLSSDIPTKQSHSAIQIIEFKCVSAMLTVSEFLFNSGFLVGSIRPPTTKTPRLRITITSAHNRQDIDELTTCIESSLKGLKIEK